MGRPRKHNPTIPEHIDQTKLPAGIYWDQTGNGRWYVLEDHPEGGTNKKTVAGRKARLSELHEIVEQRSGGEVRGTVAYVIKQFQESTEYAALSANTRKDYNYCADVAAEYITKSGQPLTDMQVDRLTTPATQKVNETLSKGKAESRPGARDAIPGRPSKAAHLLRFLRRLFDWGRRHGHCKTNPAEGVKLARERKRKRMPEHEAYAAVLKFAQERGAFKAHTKGSLPPYLWPLMEIAYLCRMRGIEVVRLTDAHASDVGIRVRRVKGSNDNVVRWTPRVRAAWDYAVSLRASILARESNRSRPVPIRPQDRYLFITQSGTPLSKAGLDNAFQDLMRAAIETGVIAEQDRFNLHGLKHRGITDTAGNKGDKKSASGHKTDAALEEYDHEIPTVDPANAPDIVIGSAK
jgi:site-specific recombinase XerD